MDTGMTALCLDSGALAITQLVPILYYNMQIVHSASHLPIEVPGCLIYLTWCVNKVISFSLVITALSWHTGKILGGC